ncbi:MAG: hypothetical protein Tsb0034_07290 [Ekhidna sp.]
MRGALRLYFGKVTIEGLERVPVDKPILVTPNHQNAFLDAFLVGAFAPIDLHFLTRSDVFKWWSKPLLRMVNMMPIYRIRDGFSKLSLNDAVFETCKNLFAEGKSVLVFPEGNHGEHYYLRPLTKGAARIALLSQTQIDQKLMIQPVGLNYFHHQKARTPVTVVFGDPIPVSDFVQAFDQNPAKGLISLRERMTEGMKQTLVIPEKTDDYDQRKRFVFQEAHHDLSFEALKTLDSRGIGPEPQTKKRWLACLVNPLPFIVIKKVISRVDDIVFHSSLKFSIGLFAFPLWWGLVFLVLSLTVGTPIALLAVVVMVSGLFYGYQ